jgi:succinyl-CoA synthetase alpha subunit
LPLQKLTAKSPMSILVNKDTRLVVQGITGKEGSFHTQQMIEYGTNVVGGVTPGKGGQSVEHNVPVFDICREAAEEKGRQLLRHLRARPLRARCHHRSGRCGRAPHRLPHRTHPVLDMIRVRSYIDKVGVRLIGPNCPGLITPGEAKVGIIPGSIVAPGPIGVVSKSGTLTYEVVYALTYRGMGQSTCVGIGGDPINGTGFIDVLEMFEADDQTEQIILMGEIGGNDEEKAAAYIAEPHHQTRHGVHRRPFCPSGAAHGPRWGNCRRWRWHGRGQNCRARSRQRQSGKTPRRNCRPAQIKQKLLAHGGEFLQHSTKCIIALRITGAT